MIRPFDLINFTINDLLYTLQKVINSLINIYASNTYNLHICYPVSGELNLFVCYEYYDVFTTHVRYKERNITSRYRKSVFTINLYYYMSD